MYCDLVLVAHYYYSCHLLYSLPTSIKRGEKETWNVGKINRGRERRGGVVDSNGTMMQLCCPSHPPKLNNAGRQSSVHDWVGLCNLPELYHAWRGVYCLRNPINMI